MTLIDCLRSQWPWMNNCFCFNHECLQRFFIQTATVVCNNDANIYLAEWILRSHMPLMWLAAGGFLFYCIQSALLFWRKPWIFLSPISLNAWINSCSAPTRFGPLSECICLTFPLLAISFLSAWMKESFVILS